MAVHHDGVAPVPTSIEHPARIDHVRTTGTFRNVHDEDSLGRIVRKADRLRYAIETWDRLDHPQLLPELLAMLPADRDTDDRVLVRGLQGFGVLDPEDDIPAQRVRHRARF